MSEHTPEPWEAFTECPGQCCWLIRTVEDAEGHSELITSPETSEEDARRIVACVNACTGSKTQDLKHYASLGGVEKIISLLDQDRDELREAIAELVQALKDIHDHPNCRYEVEAQLGEETWDVIAKYDTTTKETK